MEISETLNYQKIEAVTTFTVPVGYSFVVAGDFVVDGILIVDGDMRNI